jgi:hypothetical protein
VKLRSRPLRVLDFDLESRPLGWIGADYVHQEVTVAAFGWMGETPQARALSKNERSRLPMLRAVRRAYDEADMVVGHYIRSFDLPLLNAMLVEAGEPPLAQKLTHDTKSDLVRMSGVSKSQVNLAAMFGLLEEKQYMTVSAWREANRLTVAGVQGAVGRAVADVAQNMALYAVLKQRRLLGPPKVWRPT